MEPTQAEPGRRRNPRPIGRPHARPLAGGHPENTAPIGTVDACPPGRPGMPAGMCTRWASAGRGRTANSHTLPSLQASEGPDRWRALAPKEHDGCLECFGCLA